MMKWMKQQAFEERCNIRKATKTMQTNDLIEIEVVDIISATQQDQGKPPKFVGIVEMENDVAAIWTDIIPTRTN